MTQNKSSFGSAYLLGGLFLFVLLFAIFRPASPSGEVGLNEIAKTQVTQPDSTSDSPPFTLPNTVVTPSIKPDASVFTATVGLKVGDLDRNKKFLRPTSMTPVVMAPYNVPPEYVRKLREKAGAPIPEFGTNGNSSGVQANFGASSTN